MTHNTSAEDATDRANSSPADAATADIEKALDGRRLFSNRVPQKIDGCRRCDEKNQKRRHAGIGTVDSTFDDGDDVTLHAVYDDDSSIADNHWLVTAAAHREHPQLPFRDVVSQETNLVRAHARVRDRDGERGKQFVDVDVIKRSRAGDGPVQSVVARREQSQIDDDAPGGMTVIDIAPDEAPAHWPEEDRQWLQKLAHTFNLARRTYSIEKTGSTDANPGGNGQR